MDGHGADAMEGPLVRYALYAARISDRKERETSLRNFLESGSSNGPFAVVIRNPDHRIADLGNFSDWIPNERLIDATRFNFFCISRIILPHLYLAWSTMMGETLTTSH